MATPLQHVYGGDYGDDASSSTSCCGHGLCQAKFDPAEVKKEALCDEEHDDKATRRRNSRPPEPRVMQIRNRRVMHGKHRRKPRGQ